MSAITEQSKGFSKDDEVILSPTQQIIIKFKNNKLAMFGFWLFVSIVSVVVVTHFYTKFTGYDFSATHPELKNLPPSWQHPFGTDRYGRNTFVRVLEGGWISLQVGFLSTIMAVTIGVTMGAISGYFGGKIDALIMRIVEVIYSFPFLAIAYIISAIFRDRPAEFRLFVIIGILGFIRWTGLARLVRGQILSLKEQEFILAAKALGIKKRNQIMRHLIPNVMAMVVVSGTLTFANAILGEAFLSFLGLSVTEPIPTWGALLAKASSNSTSLRSFWWIWVFPGTMLFMFIMSINLIGEGLRDAIDPKAEFTTKEEKKAAKERRKAQKKAAKEGKLVSKGGAM
ncbi:ABC transporter permease [Alkaliphilus hydrothermalis]|uniref:Peptide/nickel transport system permease protein n=1 Tax=Alkaliphilus hydrothermalis TaxID=1482730 RepID=A0ABS2NPU7_9FIRM|nr:ABC transporter permease [Alkaliphilus hydrothermalis]MBM7614619.1 peptide/nickel transport system permease protein [Alkaliphilus hydrothermalis]